MAYHDPNTRRRLAFAMARRRQTEHERRVEEYILDRIKRRESYERLVSGERLQKTLSR